MKNKLYKKIKSKIFKRYIFFVTTFFIVLNASVLFANSLEEGIYEIVNPINGKNMYVNENGKILLKSISNNSNVDCFKDLFTGKPKILYEYYTRVGEIEINPYEEWSDEWYNWENKHRDMDSFGARNHIYENAVTPDTRYYDLSGKEIFKDRKDNYVIGAFDDYIIFNDGTFYNLLLNTKVENTEIKKDREKNIVGKWINVDTFADYILMHVDAYDGSYYGGILYIYDKNTNFIKKFEKYNICKEVYNYDTCEWEKTNFIDDRNHKYLFVENYIGNQYLYNLIDKNLNLLLEEPKEFFRKKMIGDRIIHIENYNEEQAGFFEIKKEKLKTELQDNDSKFVIYTGLKETPKVIINNIIYSKVENANFNMFEEDEVIELIEFNNTKYIYSKSYHNLLDFDGKEIVNLAGLPYDGDDFRGNYKFYSFNNKYFILINQYDIIIYDKDFKQLLYLNTDAYEEAARKRGLDKIKSMKEFFGGEYYYMDFDWDGYLLFDKTFKNIIGSHNFDYINVYGFYHTIIETDINITGELNANYLYDIGNKYIVTMSKIDGKGTFKYDIYDKKLKKIKELGELFRLKGVDIYGKNYYYAAHYGNPPYIDLYDDNFNKVIDENEKYVEILCEENNFNSEKDYYEDYVEYIEEGTELFQELHKCAVIKSKEKETRNKLRYVNCDFNTLNEIEFDEYNHLSDEYAVVKCYNNKSRNDYSYSLYRIGFGEVLKEYKYIGKLRKDYFTFANGFYYGLMDYDFNILCQYSIFDSFGFD